MKRREWITIFVLILGLSAFAYFHHRSQPSPKLDNQHVQAAPEGFGTLPTRAELLALTNKARRENGVSPVKEDPRLDESAQRKADEEYNQGYSGHINPKTGIHGYQYVWDVWPDCPIPGENIVSLYGTDSSANVITSWLDSPPHRMALLNPKDIAIGFGFNHQYTVAHFCTAK